jgi:hypothetical protein
MAIAASLLTACAAQATTVGQTNNNDIYTYTLNLPTIENSSEVDAVMTQYQFSWVGPYKYNAADNTACPTVCGPVLPLSSVKAGYNFSGFTFTADLALMDAEPEVGFEDALNASNTITFSFIEPNSFWAQTGANLAFTNSNNDGTGAFWQIGGSDPACAGCTVTISAASPTPEPRSWMLLLAPIGVWAVAAWRKRARTAV